MLLVLEVLKSTFKIFFLRMSGNLKINTLSSFHHFLELVKHLKDFVSLVRPWTSMDIAKVKQFSSVIQSCPTLCDSTNCSKPGFPIANSWNLLKLMSIELVMPSSHPCHPLLLLSSFFPSIRVFSKESAFCIRWPKYWSFRFNISLSNEYSGLISFRIDWFDLLAVQGTLKSLLQNNSSKASVLQHSAFL